MIILFLCLSHDVKPTAGDTNDRGIYVTWFCWDLI